MSRSLLSGAGSLRRAGPVRAFLRIPWIGDLAKSAFWSATYLATGSTVEREVAGTTATFEVENRYDCRYLADLGGEREVVADLLASLRPGDVFWDVGAYHGVYACLAAQQLERGSVVAVEPHPGNAERLERNLDRNGLEATILPIALSDEASKGSLVQTEERKDALQRLSAGPHGDGQPIEALRGDDLLAQANVPPPNVIKIDVEGHELQVLEGMEGILDRGDCRRVYVELHQADRPLDDLQTTIRRELENHGFLVTELFRRTYPDELQPFVRAIKPDR